MRLGSHDLPIVAGRFFGNRHIARADRVCTHCVGIDAADEVHMIHERSVTLATYAALFTSNTLRARFLHDRIALTL